MFFKHLMRIKHFQRQIKTWCGNMNSVTHHPLAHESRWGVHILPDYQILVLTGTSHQFIYISSFLLSWGDMIFISHSLTIYLALPFKNKEELNSNTVFLFGVISVLSSCYSSWEGGPACSSISSQCACWETLCRVLERVGTTGTRILGYGTFRFSLILISFSW
jgi:hypothetical protein